KARASIRPAAKPGAAAPGASAASGSVWSDWSWRGRTAALVLVMLAGVGCAIFAVLHRTPATAAPPPSGGAEMELLLGVGDYDEAVKQAERRWGRESKEYQA